MFATVMTDMMSSAPTMNPSPHPSTMKLSRSPPSLQSPNSALGARPVRPEDTSCRLGIGAIERTLRSVRCYNSDGAATSSGETRGGLFACHRTECRGNLVANI